MCNYTYAPWFFERELQAFAAEPHSSVGSIQDLSTRGRWFDPRLGQNSFQGLTIVVTTEFIPLSHRCLLFRLWLCGKATSGLETILCGVLVKRTRGTHE